jgi:hypothetical protein
MGSDLQYCTSTTQRAPLSGGAERMTDETLRIHNIGLHNSRPDEQLQLVDCSNGIIRPVIFSHGEAKKNIVVVSMVVSMAFLDGRSMGQYIPLLHVQCATCFLLTTPLPSLFTSTDFFYQNPGKRSLEMIESG